MGPHPYGQPIGPGSKAERHLWPRNTQRAGAGAPQRRATGAAVIEAQGLSETSYVVTMKVRWGEREERLEWEERSEAELGASIPDVG